MRRDIEVLAARGQHAAPVGGGRLHAETEERQAGQRCDHAADIERHGDDQGRQAIAQHVCERQAELRHAERPRALDILRLLHREHGGADDAPVERDIDHGHRDHAVDEPRAQRRDNGDREQEVREGHQGVDRSHDELVDPASDEAGQEPAERAREGGQGRRRQPHHERNARAVQEAAQQVAAELVGAEGIPGREDGGEAARGVDGVGVSRSEPGRQHGEDSHDRDQAQAEEGRAAPPEDADDVSHSGSADRRSRRGGPRRG